MGIDSLKSVVSNNVTGFLFHNESTLNERCLMLEFHVLFVTFSGEIVEGGKL